MSDDQGMSGWMKLLLGVLVGALLFLSAIAGAYFLLADDEGDEGDDATAAADTASAEAAPAPSQAAPPQPAALPVPGGGQVPMPAPPDAVPLPLPGGGEIPIPIPQPGQLPIPQPGQLPIPLPGTTPTGQAPVPGQVPSQGAPSGQGIPIPTPTAVIAAPNMPVDRLFGATDIEIATIPWTADDPYCQRPALFTDTLQRFAHGITEAVRAGNPISAADEMQIGNEMYQAILQDPTFRGTVDTRPDLQRYVTAVARPLLAVRQREGIQYTFHIVDQPVVNAFATPGGHIYVYTGLLLDRSRIWNEAQLAGILAHEIAHVELRHTTAAYDVIQQLGGAQGAAADLAQVATALMEMPYSNEIEDAADRYAVGILFETQYSPLQFEAQWRAWDALTPNGGSMVPQVQTNDPIANLVLQVGREVENVVLSHSTDSQRACHARTLIEQFMPDYPHAGFYVGRRNLETLTARSQQMF